MPFVHSMSTRVLINDLAASAKLNSVSSNNSRAMSESTCFPDRGQRWRPGLRTGTLALEGRFDDSELLTAAVDANGVDDAWMVTVGPSGFGLGEPVFTAAGDISTHSITAAVADVVGFTVESTSDERTWIGTSLHDLTAETATADGEMVTFGAATTSGAVAVLHLTELGGTTPTADIVVQHSADGVTFVDLVTFDQATTAGAQRKVVSGTVERYVRASWALGGTAPSATFTVALAR